MQINLPQADLWIVSCDGEFHDAGAHDEKKMQKHGDKIHEFMVEIMKNEQFHHGYWYFGFNKNATEVEITFMGCSCKYDD